MTQKWREEQARPTFPHEITQSKTSIKTWKINIFCLKELIKRNEIKYMYKTKRKRSNLEGTTGKRVGHPLPLFGVGPFLSPNPGRQASASLPQI